MCYGLYLLLLFGIIFLSNDERNDSMSENTTNKIGLINLPDLPESVDNAAKNLTDIPTKNAGQTFGDIWYLVFGGISHAADKKRMKYAADLDQYRKELDEAIDRIPEEKKIEPSIQVTAQALENSKYCISSKPLRDMFVKLISGTMNIDLEPLAHPSFPEMIKQMDITDAHLLMELKRSNYQAPIVNYLESFKEEGSYLTAFQNIYISKLFKISMLKTNRSISSLERMGLIKVSFNERISAPYTYEEFYNTPLFIHFQNEINRLNRPSEATIQKGICLVTPLGKDFISLCCP